ncbi:MAG: aminotransferase class V-fold PLP-dependent enzyme [Candidatus Eisenbacteria bacterium]|nr:aminotransferase class V-fold PLP-dependent enzyme [Candidatus Eisenbacteria bacterium]
MDINIARDEFPAAKDCVHLNSASRSIMPRGCVDAVARYAKTAHLIDPEKPSEFSTVVADVRSLVAELINASPADIALSWNTSVPLNIVAQGMRVGPGDRIVVGRAEFPANLYPWENLRAKGVEVTILPQGRGYTTVEDVRRALTEDSGGRRTVALALSFVAFQNGYKADLEEIGRICRQNGVMLVVDGIQGLGAMELDVQKCGIDVLASGGQKWLLSPFGTGFLYCSPAARQVLFPSFAGWLSVKGMDKVFATVLGIPFDLVEDSRRFEIGTLAYQDLAGFRESLKLILAVGVGNIQAHILGLLDGLIDGLRELPVEIRSVLEPAHRSGILAFECRNSVRVKQELEKEGIIVAAREGGIRVSPHVYNKREEIDLLSSALKKHVPTLARRGE